ncbi:MAG: murein tripeptide amidase MpaA, partial [Paraglaciecola sp.]
MRISSNFDGGNIQVIHAENETDIQLSIQKDNQSDFFQWFYFKLDSTSLMAH